MSKRKSALFIVLSLILGSVVGYSVNSMTVSRYNTINATCTLINVAVDNHMLSPDQIVKIASAERIIRLD